MNDEILAEQLDFKDPFECEPHRDPDGGGFLWFRHPDYEDVYCKFGHDRKGRLCKLWLRGDLETKQVVLLTIDVASEREEILLRKMNEPN